MRINLNVPFAEKDDAKKLGAKWDPINKVWYVVDPLDLSLFIYWLDDEDIPDDLDGAEWVRVMRNMP